MANHFFAIDAGFTALRLVEFSLDGRGAPRVDGLQEVSLEPGPEKKEDSFPIYLNAMQKLAEGGKFKGLEGVVVMGGPSVFARLIKIPAGNPAQLQRMIGFEAQQAVPAIEQALWDYQGLGLSPSQEFEALLLAIKKDSVDEIMAAGGSAGFRTVAVDLAPTSLVNVFRYNYPEVSDCTLILEIGARATNLVLWDEEKIFSRVIPIGGLALTQAISTELQDSIAGAETLKLGRGFVHPGGSYEDAADPVVARMSKLARGVMTRLHTELERSLTFYRSQLGGRKPAQVLLAGGGSCLPYADLFIQEKLRIPVRYLQPFRRIALGPAVPKAVVQKRFPVWASAVGAGLRFLKDAPCRLNVMGKKERLTADQQRDRPAWVLAGILASLGLFLPGAHNLWKAGFLRQDLEVQSQKVQAAEEALGELESARQKLNQDLGLAQLALALEQERDRWPRLLAALNQIFREEFRDEKQSRMWITSLALEGLAEGKSPEAPSGTPKPANPPVPSLILDGLFETRSKDADAKAVEIFRSALEKTSLFSSVRVVERETPQEVDGKTEQVALKFKIVAIWPITKPAGGAPAASPPRPGP